VGGRSPTASAGARIPLAIWLFGFHVALPAGILFYVRVHGMVSWAGSIVLALLFLGLLIGVYDNLLNATWHESPVLNGSMPSCRQSNG